MHQIPFFYCSADASNIFFFFAHNTIIMNRGKRNIRVEHLQNYISVSSLVRVCRFCEVTQKIDIFVSLLFPNFPSFWAPASLFSCFYEIQWKVREKIYENKFGVVWALFCFKFGASCWFDEDDDNGCAEVQVSRFVLNGKARIYLVFNKMPPSIPHKKVEWTIVMCFWSLHIQKVYIFLREKRCKKCVGKIEWY